MAGTLVVAMAADGGRTVDEAALAASARSLVLAGWHVVVMAGPPGPEGITGTTLALELGQSRSGRRAVPVVAHVLVDPADPALARPSAADHPEPLAVLEAEAIASLNGHFPVVVTSRVPVVPHGEAYRPVAADLDPAATARRLAGDLGAGVLAFITGGADGPVVTGEIDALGAQEHAADGGPLSAELRAAARFVRAGGELALVTPAAGLARALHGAAFDASDDGVLRIRHTVARRRAAAPALTAGLR
ncbi:MAG TPA: hypothetical protein VFS16_02405 [Acidimicrobiia bacterium]|nr:hypothetical protein [Acidimicrobiia bacterium]